MTTAPAVSSMFALSGDPARRVLDLDFALPAPQLVTAILSALYEGRTDEDVWSLPVETRIERLIAALACAGEPSFWVELRCANDPCAEAIEVDLVPSELLALAAAGRDLVAVRVDDLEIRRPTGEDQLRWQQVLRSDQGVSLTEMASELVTAPGGRRANDELVAAVEEALAVLDPLVAFDLAVVCPYCDWMGTHEIDLLPLIIQRFWEHRARLLDEVHTLAMNYHWSEADIVALPAARRAHYLAAIDREAN